MTHFTDIVYSTAELVNARFGERATQSKLAAANSLMLSKCLDLLVEHQVITEQEREVKMQYLYHEIGLLAKKEN